MASDESTFTCLAVSGYPSGTRTWEALADALPTAWRLRVVALPDEVGTTLDQQRDAVIAEVRAAGSAVLVGHSLGAYLVGRALAHVGDRVALAVMIGGFASLTAEAVARTEGLARLLEQGALEGEARRSLVHEQLIAPDVPDASGIELIESMFLGVATSDLTRMVRRGLGAGDVTASVEPHRASAVVVQGTDDRATPMADAQRLAERGSNTVLVPIDGAGHFLHVAHADRVARAIVARLPR